MAADPAVVRIAYNVASSMGASDKVKLALFEAAIVESGFRNLPHGADDSVGYLQQRPSQGWPNPMDVTTATRSFVSRAIAREGSAATAGQLAQAVQRSAYPLRYDAVRAQATQLLLQASQGKYTGTATGVSYDATPTGIGTSLDNVKKGLDILTSPDFAKQLMFSFGGATLVFIGIILILGIDIAKFGGKFVKAVT